MRRTSIGYNRTGFDSLDRSQAARVFHGASSYWYRNGELFSREDMFRTMPLPFLFFPALKGSDGSPT